MLKHELRNRIRDRAPSRYPNSVVRVLCQILDLTFVVDWKQSAVERCFSRPQSISRLAFKCNLCWETTKKALAVLLKDGVIREHQYKRGSYCIVPTALQMLDSCFRNTEVKRLERKILKALRMRFARDAERISIWQGWHPSPKGVMYAGEAVFLPACNCAGIFCSHPCGQ